MMHTRAQRRNMGVAPLVALIPSVLEGVSGLFGNNTPPPPPDNTPIILAVVGGIAVIGVVFLVSNKKTKGRRK